MNIRLGCLRQNSHFFILLPDWDYRTTYAIFCSDFGVHISFPISPGKLFHSLLLLTAGTFFKYIFIWSFLFLFKSTISSYNCQSQSFYLTKTSRLNFILFHFRREPWCYKVFICYCFFFFWNKHLYFTHNLLNKATGFGLIIWMCVCVCVFVHRARQCQPTTISQTHKLKSQQNFFTLK